MLRTFLKLLTQIKQTFPIHSFKIVNITGDPHQKNTNIIYQVCGKKTTIPGKPLDLLGSFLQLEGFSKEDSHLIYALAISEKQSPALKIIAIYFEKNEHLFEIEDISHQYNLILTANQIMASKKMIEKFSTEDREKIYFQYMKEHDTLTRKNIKNINKIERTSCDNNNNLYILKNL